MEETSKWRTALKSVAAFQSSAKERKQRSLDESKHSVRSSNSAVSKQGKSSGQSPSFLNIKGLKVSTSEANEEVKAKQQAKPVYFYSKENRMLCHSLEEGDLKKLKDEAKEAVNEEVKEKLKGYANPTATTASCKKTHLSFAFKLRGVLHAIRDEIGDSLGIRAHQITFTVSGYQKQREMGWTHPSLKEDQELDSWMIIKLEAAELKYEKEEEAKSDVESCLNNYPLLKTFREKEAIIEVSSPLPPSKIKISGTANNFVASFEIRLRMDFRWIKAGFVKILSDVENKDQPSVSQHQIQVSRDQISVSLASKWRIRELGLSPSSSIIIDVEIEEVDSADVRTLKKKLEKLKDGQQSPQSLALYQAFYEDTSETKNREKIEVPVLVDSSIQEIPSDVILYNKLLDQMKKNIMEKLKHPQKHDRDEIKEEEKPSGKIGLQRGM